MNKTDADDLNDFSPSRRQVRLLKSVSKNDAEYFANLEMLRFGTPLEYIVGHKEIAGRRFKVDRRTYIPTDVSTLILDQAVDLLAPGQLALDVGSGCGWLAISLKLACPEAEVVGTDIEAGALDVARENAALHGADVKFVRAYFGRGIAFDRPPDVVVAILPYNEDGYRYVPDQLLTYAHQPGTAVFPTGGPASAYAALLEEVRDRDWGSKIVCEVGWMTDNEVHRELGHFGFKVDIVRDDLFAAAVLTLENEG